MKNDSNESQKHNKTPKQLDSMAFGLFKKLTI